jgi:hypothetical protein
MRLALANLDWLVVRDFQPGASATFWKDSVEHESGEARAPDIQTEVFFRPEAPHTRDGWKLHQRPAAASGGGGADSGSRLDRACPATPSLPGHD